MNVLALSFMACFRFERKSGEMEQSSDRDHKLQISNSTDDKAKNESFSEIASIAKGWIIDFSLFSLCHYFKEAEHLEFENSVRALEAFLEGSAQLEFGQRKKVDICGFLARIVHGKQDIQYENDERVMPLMSAISIWSSLGDVVVDRALFEHVRNLLFVQSIGVCMERGDYGKASWTLQWLSEECTMPPNLKMKLSLIINQKDAYHKFLMNFSFDALVESVKTFLDRFLKEHRSDFLVRAASKVLTSCREKVTEEATSSNEVSDTFNERQERNSEVSTPVPLRMRPKRALFSARNTTPWKPDTVRKPPKNNFHRPSRTKRVTRVSSRYSSPSKSESSMRSKRKLWTSEEDEMLRAGVKHHGTGRWAKILLDFDFGERTGVMLKDRWRTLQKLGVVN